jgi:hypothetical protein
VVKKQENVYFISSMADAPEVLVALAELFAEGKVLMRTEANMNGVPEPKRQPFKRGPQKFQRGDHVVAVSRRSEYGLEGGERGQIIAAQAMARGYRYTIRWEDKSESDAPQSILKKVRAK